MRLLLAWLVFTVSAFAAGGPENVLIIVNADSWASTRIANEYVALRGIPANNVVLLRDIPSFERMSVEEVRNRILRPAIAAAEVRGLGGQIDYVLYSADFPTAVDVSEDTKGQQIPKVLTQPASLNALTYLYRLTLAKSPGYLGLTNNFYFRKVSQVAPENPWPEAEQKEYNTTLATFQRISATREKAAPGSPEADAGKDELTEARKSLLALKEKHPTSTELLYNLACVQARLGDADAAIIELRTAMKHGWWDMRHAQQDPDLRSLWQRQDFKSLVAASHVVKFELIPTCGFRASIGWLPNGQPTANGGMRYLLSTFLGVTSGRGNSVQEVVSYLRRSATADATRPKGSIYYLENQDVRSTTREWGFNRAAEKLRELGVQAAIQTGVLPPQKADVMGATIGTADFNWHSSGSTLLPGALGDNLTSCGGMMGEGDPQTPLTEFLRYGAAGASGTVAEPYAIQAKFPTPFLHLHYAQGCTMAEAYYQSLSGPYQLLIVGDALCAPWKKRFSVSADEIKQDAVIKGTLTLTPKTESADNIQPGTYELYLDGRRVAAARSGEPLKWDSTTAPDGIHDLTLAANGLDDISTRTSISAHVVIQNSTSTVKITAPKGDWAWDKPLEIKASAEGAQCIVFRNGVEEIARCDGATGDVTIDPRKLGEGPVRIQPVAKLPQGKEVQAAPITLNIIPPRALAAKTPPGAMQRGFIVTPAGGKPAVCLKAEGDWLTTAGVKKGEAFTVEGWFEAAESTVHQFQLRGPSKLTLSVNGRELDWPRGREWWYVPVPLQKGLHFLKIEGVAGEAPQLDVRFGGPGTRRLDGDRFQHPL